MRATIRFDDVADELYAVDPSAFVALREDRAARARRQGDRELARRIHHLRKPTTAAALVNRLVRRWPGDVAGLVELGERLRAAHEAFEGERIRKLAQDRDHLVRELLERAQALATAPPGESVLTEISATLRAAVADAEAAIEVSRARLTTALTPVDVFADDRLPSGSPSARECTGGRRGDALPGEEGCEDGGTDGRAEAGADERRLGGTTERGAGAAGRSRTPSRSGERRARTAKPGTRARRGPRAIAEAAPDPAERRTSRTQPGECEEAPRGDGDIAEQRTRRRERDRVRREEEVRARRARDDARQELHAAERAEAAARERTAAARHALERAERAVRDHTA